MCWDSWAWIAASVIMVRRRAVLRNWKFYSTPKNITIKDQATLSLGLVCLRF